MNTLRTYKDKAGRTQVTMAKSERKEDQLCDFCSSQERPFKLFMCSDFPIDGVKTMSTGGWLACPECARLINARDQENLTKRSVKAFHDPSVPEWFSRQSLRLIHKKFFKNLISDC